MVIAAAIAIVSATGGEARAGDPAALITALSQKPNGAYVMKLGTRLRSDWQPVVGTNLNFAGTEHSPVWRPAAEDPPSGNLWASIAMPARAHFLGWDGARLRLEYEPAQNRGDMQLITNRHWALNSLLSARFEDRYTLLYKNEPDRPPGFQTTQQLSLAVAPTGTTFQARTSRGPADSQFHTSLSAQQDFAGRLKITTYLNDLSAGNRTVDLRAEHEFFDHFKFIATGNDLFSDHPYASIRTEQQLFGMLKLTASIDDISSQAPISSIRARLSRHW